MRDFLKMMIDDVAAGPNSGTVPSMLRLSSFVDGKELSKATAAWQSTLGILQSGVVKPTATIILCLLFIMELAAITQRVDGGSELGLQLVGKTFLKFALCKVAFDNLGTILTAINSIAVGWASQASAKMTPGATGVTMNTDAFLDNVDHQGFMVKGFAALLIMLGWLLAKIPVFAMIALLITRFIKLQVMAVAAPLPMCFVAHRETQGIATGFLKNYGAVSLQLLFIVLVVPLFAIMSTFILQAVEPGNSLRFILQLTGALLLVGLVSLGLLRVATEASREVMGL